MNPRPKDRKRTRRLLLALAALLLAQHSAASDIERQRALFLSIYADVEMGLWDPVESLENTDRSLLERYVLWPDLRAAWLRAKMRTVDHATVETFLDRYGTLKPARELRYRYALHLARTGDLDGYLEIYEAFYQGFGIPRLDCIALHAEIRAGRENRVANRARELWMTGGSQVEECSPVFKYLRDANKLSEDDYRARYALAFESREFSRARWLARSIDETLVEETTQWLRAQSSPERFIAARHGHADTELTLLQLAYAVERLAVEDPGRAQELWARLQKTRQFPSELRHSTSRHIALQAAYSKLDGAYELLASLPLDVQDREVLRWRAKASLGAGRWSDLLNDIAMMSDAERDSEQWRYWQGLALARTNDADASRSVLAALAAERSYYGFLAADEVGIAYEFADARLPPDELLIEKLATRDELIRARELFLVGLDGRGRSEWDAAVAWLTPREKVQAAILADRWGWHSRAIATAASIGDYDDLALRYPLPWKHEFEQHASSANIPATWALGVARSESLFMRDARSSAGAVGVMQLLPSTGRKLASRISLPYSGLETLTDPVMSIRLGTRYLGDMAERYDGNRVLATAAYNAGPHRVDRWLPESGAVDARVWIEGIPYRETRRYVRRVMTAKTIFHWRLTGEVRRLTPELQVVKPATADRRVAAR
jgi:soluble lytic murein transglycosylase